MTKEERTKKEGLLKNKSVAAKKTENEIYEHLKFF